jgi:hypothetical protein
MIHCYFDTSSYYIIGKEIEVYSTLKNPEIDSLRQSYWALLMLLPELALEKDNITIHTDTRLIDEMNGEIGPLDDWTRQAKHIVNQMTASLCGIVLFRKLDATKLAKSINSGREKLIDTQAKHRILQDLEKKWQQQHSQRVKRLRQSFFGEGNGN